MTQPAEDITGWVHRSTVRQCADRIAGLIRQLEHKHADLEEAVPNAELLRLLERHHKESIADDRFLQEGTEHYVGTDLYLKTEAAIERAKEKV